jgi:hypothetical protein
MKIARKGASKFANEGREKDRKEGRKLKNANKIAIKTAK